MNNGFLNSAFLRLSGAAALLVIGVAIGANGAGAQQAPAKCVYQYSDASGVTAAGLIAGGFDIKAGWPGGLWLQKGKETYFCNTGRVPEDTVLCWTLREPVKGQACQ